MNTRTHRLLTVDELYHPDRNIDFDDRHCRQWRWSDWGACVGIPSLKSRSVRTAVVVDPETGREEVLYDLDEVSAALDRANGSPDPTRRSETAPPDSVVLLNNPVRALAVLNDTVFTYHFASGEARPLMRGLDAAAGVVPSPCGTQATVVVSNDLHVLEIDTGRTRKIAGTGTGTTLTGRLDWVYQEEIYGRGRYAASWWSPDSSRIAFLELDVAHVNIETIPAKRGSPGTTQTYRYPRAGTPNPSARVGIADVATGQLRWIVFPGWESVEHLVARVRWSPGSDALACQIQDREQRRLDLAFVDPREGSATIVLTESEPMPWVRPQDAPWWLDDGTWIWPSERTGRNQLYRYAADGDFLGAVTPFEWDVRQIHGIRPETANLYFSAVRHESRSLQACVVRIGAPDTVNSLTRSTGTHQSTFARDCSAFVDVWSATGRPPEVRLHTVDAADEGRLLYSAPAAGLLDAYTLGRVESHAVRARDGHVLGAMMIKPPDFDPNRKYPVLCYVYGGPGTPVVRDAWGGATFLWHHMIAARGAIVWLLDNRSASGADARSAWAAHVDRGEGFGPTELRDVEDGLDWLATQRYVDPERIGIWGWSFGGYLTAYAMTHTKRFRVGVAGAAVTDWSLYDTVYTERYLGVLRGVPGRSQEAYRQSSVIGAAPHLHGKLLIVHGTADDNVHAENSIRLVDALQQAGRDFELMLYPGAQHAIEDERQLYDLRRRMTAFLVDNL